MSRFKKFDVLGGGLIVEDKFTEDEELCLGAPDSFSVPPYIDSRPYCIPASHQGSDPSCAGFSIAGFKEICNWRETGVQKQFDGLACYQEAKRIDRRPSVAGTTLTAAIQASQSLGWFPSESKIQSIRTKRDLQFALHKHGACIAGFMITKEWQLVDLDTGFISNSDGTKLGGHAVLICYYDDVCIGWQNSWGPDWGVNGFGRMTWAQFEKQFIYAAVMV